MVFDKVVRERECDKVVCVTKLYVKDGVRWCGIKLCVKDGV